MNNTRAKIDTIFENNRNEFKKIFTGPLKYAQKSLIRPFLSQEFPCISFCLVSILALSSNNIQGGLSFDAARLIPPAGWTFLGLFNSGFEKDLLFRGIICSGFILQNWQRIILLICTFMAVAYKLTKLIHSKALSFPEQAEKKVTALTSPVATGNMETGMYINVADYRTTYNYRFTSEGA